MLKYLFLAILVTASIIHLYFCYKKNNRGRFITKPMLMLALLAFYVTASPAPEKLLIIALICSWIGDVLLMKSGSTFLVLGGAFFIAAHVCFMLRFASMIGQGSRPWILVALLGALLLTGAYFTDRDIKDKIAKPLRYAMFVYLIINSAMNIFAFLNLAAHPSLGAALASIGALLFFISDCDLYLVMYSGRKGLAFDTNFVVMLTYILAESLIISGALLG